METSIPLVFWLILSMVHPEPMLESAIATTTIPVPYDNEEQCIGVAVELKREWPEIKSAICVPQHQFDVRKFNGQENYLGNE